MKAKIVDIEDNAVTIKTEGGKFVTVPRKKLKFDCSLGQSIIVEKNDGKFYFLPESTSFWGDEDEKSVKKKKPIKKSIIVLASLLLACIICLAPFGYQYLKAKKNEQRIIDLHACMDNAGSTALPVDEALPDSEKRSLDQTNEISKNNDLIRCEETYGDGTNDAIDQYKKNIELVEIEQCTDEAKANYAVSQEEIDSSNSDLEFSLVLVKRVGDGLRAQRSCYSSKGKLGDYSYAIDKLDADISENEAMVEYIESSINSRNSTNERFSNWYNCTTNYVGSSAYTSCY